MSHPQQPSARKPRRTGSFNLFSEKTAPYLFILPFYTAFILFSFWPIVRALLISFTDQKGVKPGAWVGLRNYSFMLQDSTFWHAVLNTALVWLLAVPALAFGSLILAVILDQQWMRGRVFYRVSIFSPVIVSLVVAGSMFLLLLDPDFGPLGKLLVWLGLPSVNLMTDQWAALPIIALVTLWRWLGWNMVIQLAGLQTIPVEVDEAAIVDGATAPQRFWYVTLPLMRPIIVLVMILSTIGTFNQFDEPYILLGPNGGPGEAGLMIGPFIYRAGLVFFKFGYASAVAYVVAFFVFAASLLQYRIAGRAEGSRG